MPHYFFWCLHQVPELHTTPHVRDHNRSAHNQHNVKALPQLLITAPDVHALVDVVRDAVIAPPDAVDTSEPKKFLGLLITPPFSYVLPSRLKNRLVTSVPPWGVLPSRHRARHRRPGCRRFIRVRYC